MIHESSPWKDLLARDADLIERWAQKPLASVRRSVLIEQKIFMSAYSMRKLFEARKLSSNLNDTCLSAERYARLPDRALTWHNDYRFDEVYDLTTSENCSIGVRDVLNLIIHSRLFVESCDHKSLRITGLLVTSRKRDASLWLIPIDRYVGLMRSVASDNPTAAILVFDADADEPFSWRGDGRPPPAVRQKMDRFRNRRNATSR